MPDNWFFEESWREWNAEQRGPTAMTPDEKHRYLRQLHRDHTPSVTWNGNKMIINQSEQSEQTRIVQEAYEELGCDIPLANILVNVWIEERELRGEKYDSIQQCWRDAEGRKVD